MGSRKDQKRNNQKEVTQPICEQTEYGFRYRSATISRCCSDAKQGWIILLLNTPKYQDGRGIQIYVTKSGKVRVYGPDRDGKESEWTPASKCNTCTVRKALDDLAWGTGKFAKAAAREAQLKTTNKHEEHATD